MADIVHSILVQAEPAALYPLVSTGVGFKAWWAEDVTLVPDGAIDLGFFGRQTVYRLRSSALEEDRRAVWKCETGQEWKGTRLEFELEARGGASLVRFSHREWARVSDFFVSCNTTWGELMFRLKAAAEGKKPGPLFLADGLAY
jgi:hypothetical protein